MSDLPSISHESTGVRLRRAARVLVRSGMLADASPSRVPQIVGLARAHGLGVGTVHALQAIRNPNRVAIIDGTRTWTYASLNDEINRFADGLRRALDVGQGDAVALMMENCAEYVVAWFACFRLGARAVHVSYDATVEELAYLLEHSSARTVVCDAARFATVAGARAAAALRCEIVFHGSLSPAHADARTYADVLDRGASDLVTPGSKESVGANVVYTSGTTGRPKGAVRRFGAVGPDELMRIVDRTPLRVAERHLVVSRMYHSGAQAFVLLMTSLGATLIIHRRFDAAAVLDALHEDQITSMFLVPTMIRRLVDLVEVDDRARPSAFRALFSGAGAFPDALRRRAIRAFGVGAVFDFYGATELGWITLANGRDMLLRPGTVGRPIGGQEIAAFDRDGRRCGPREVGVLSVRSSHAIEGYLNNQEATDEIMSDGWITVEDTGYVDEAGYVFLSGRARDMIISGGVNIYPVEIEEVIAAFPGVVETAVVGLPDEEWGERVAACVVFADGVPGCEDALNRHVRARLSGAKIPRAWFFMSSLPRNATGKVLKRVLRETHANAT